MTTLARLDALLSTPDPDDLKGRGYKITCAGDPKRRQTVLLPLLVRWAQYRHLGIDPAPFIAPARKGFHIVVSDRRKRA